MAGLDITGMSFHVPRWDLARSTACIFLLAIFLFSPAMPVHSEQQVVESAAAPLADMPTDIPTDRMDDAVYHRIYKSELVARVKITSVHRVIDNALSEPGMVAILGYVYSGVTQKVWKGVPGKLVAFRLTLDDCDRKLRRGVQYLIFAETDTQGRLQLSSCEAAIEESDATKLLAQLDRYYQG